MAEAFSRQLIEEEETAERIAKEKEAKRLAKLERKRCVFFPAEHLRECRGRSQVADMHPKRIHLRASRILSLRRRALQATTP